MTEMVTVRIEVAERVTYAKEFQIPLREYEKRRADWMSDRNSVGDELLMDMFINRQDDCTGSEDITVEDFIRVA